MSTRRQWQVSFVCPGSFFNEERSMAIAGVDPREALIMSRSVAARYNAKPFAFYFVELIVSDPVSDGEGGELRVEPKEVQRTGRYHIGGKILSHSDVESKPGCEILARNMKGNDWPFVIESTAGGFLTTQPFGLNDVVIDPKSGDIVERGDSPERRVVRDEIAQARLKEAEAIIARYGGK